MRARPHRCSCPGRVGYSCCLVWSGLATRGEWREGKYVGITIKTTGYISGLSLLMILILRYRWSMVSSNIPNHGIPIKNATFFMHSLLNHLKISKTQSFVSRGHSGIIRSLKKTTDVLCQCCYHSTITFYNVHSTDCRVQFTVHNSTVQSTNWRSSTDYK